MEDDHKKKTTVDQPRSQQADDVSCRMDVCGTQPKQYSSSIMDKKTKASASICSQRKSRSWSLMMESVLKPGRSWAKPLPMGGGELLPWGVCSILLAGQPLKMDQTELSVVGEGLQAHSLEKWGHWSKA